MTNASKPVVFLAFANDLADGLGYLRNLAEEAHRLNEALRPAEKAGLCEIVLLQNVSVERVQNVFLDSEYRDRVAVFHFGGHANGYQLLLESRERAVAAADAAGFSKFLAEQKGLRLVFLNGCSTKAQVQGLLEAGVEAVLATSSAIDDAVAMDFSDRFYTALGASASVGRAFREAESAIQMGYGTQTRDLYLEQANETEVSQTVMPWFLSTQQDSEDMVLENGLQQWTQLLPFKRQPYEPETILIPGGSFIMGAEGDEIPDHEGPSHTVTLKMYRIGRYPVTCREYAFYLRETRQTASPVLGWQGNTPTHEQECLPVSGVSFVEALAYCSWWQRETGRAYMLPSEAEWERAARGADGRLYPWGSIWNSVCCNTDPDHIARVSAFGAGVSPHGIYDMVGNVREWTRSLWGEQRRTTTYPYPWQDDERNDLTANEQIRRVLRGGVRSGAPLRATMRNSQLPRQPGLGSLPRWISRCCAVKGGVTVAKTRRSQLQDILEPELDDLFSDGESEEEDIFFKINQYLQDEKLIPIIGDTVRNEHIFDVNFDQVAGIKAKESEADSEKIDEESNDDEDDYDLDITGWLAESWAQEVKYPFRDRYHIARVAQYHRVNVGPYTFKSDYIRFQKKCLLRLGQKIAKMEDDQESLQLIRESAKRIDQNRFPDIVNELDFPRFNGREDPLRVLARLPVSIYITTGYYDFVERALEAEGKKPRTRLCLWNLKPENVEPEHRYDENYVPDPKNPVVFHLFGIEQYPSSLVLSEDDYLDFLIHLARDGSNDSGNRAIPPYLEAELTTSSLMMLGYRLHDWDFQVLFRGLINANKENTYSRRPSLAIQLDQVDTRDDARIREYLDKYFQEGNFRVVLNSTDKFISELWARWQPWAAGVNQDE